METKQRGYYIVEMDNCECWSLLLCCFVLSTFSQKTNIVFIGNSITQGVILEDPDNTSPPSQTIEWLRQNHEGSFAFSNKGVSGRTTTDFLPVTEKEFPKVKEVAERFYHEDGQLIFSIMLGTNDSAIKRAVGSQLMPEVYYQNMKRIVNELLELYPESIIVLNRPIWYSPNTYNNSMYLKEGLERLNSYFPMLKKLEENYAITHPAHVFLGDTTAFDYFKDNKELYFAENGNAGTFYLHPNEKGTKILGEFWGKAISRVLKSKPAFAEYPLNTVKDFPAINEDENRGLNAPSLRVYLPSPEKATGRMVIVLPGGGYSHLAVFHEGYDWANFFLSKGIALGVLKYRMPQTDYTIPFADVKVAFDLAKEKATGWSVNPLDIGIMGSSAGGHLASTYATHTAKEDKPAFQILLYPVVTMDESFTHGGSRMNLLGEDPSQKLIDRFSNEKRVDSSTPPAFIIFAADDKVVPPANGFRYAEALTVNNIPVTFLLYPTSGHGFGNRDSFLYKEQFMQELSKWLKEL